jgi:ribose transport system permease protein
VTRTTEPRPVVAPESAVDEVTEIDAARPTHRKRALWQLISRRLVGLWVLIAMVAVFGALRTDTFLSSVTFKTTLGDYAIPGLLALAMLLPLVAGLFDLSVASVAGFSMILSAWLSVNSDLPTPLILLLTLLAAAAFGLASAVLVTRLRVNSLVATLGMGTVALGLTELIAGHATIYTDFGDPYTQVGQGYLGDVPLPFVYILVLGAVIYYVLEHTPVGRRLQACGGNPVAARLAGVRVARLQSETLVASSLVAGFTGFVLAAKVGVAADTTAPGYLLPAVAAVFLGTTQVKDRPNVVGTILAILILATGIKGLQLLGAEAWAPDVFAGSVLLFSVGVASSGLNRIR